jgi:hypothetical protein
MRVLFDTNVWRYMVDAGFESRLFQVTRRSNLSISIAPAIIIETLRMSDVSRRRKIIELQTRDCWNRLMPDAFLQCEDVKREMIRIHPEWALKTKNINLFRKLRYDWIRTKGGFWEKVRNNPEKIAEQYKRQDSAALTQVREQSREVRKSVFEKNLSMVNTSSLRDWRGSWRNPITGEEVVADAWRVYAELIWRNMLSTETAFKQWLGCDLDIKFLLSFYSSEYMRFWQSEASVEAVPREWIRASVYGLQSERKVTDGNPTDSAIATHAVDVDLIVSADKNFIAMLNRLQDEAPFKTAHGLLVQAGTSGAEEILNILNDSTMFAPSSNTRH